MLVLGRICRPETACMSLTTVPKVKSAIAAWRGACMPCPAYIGCRVFTIRSKISNNNTYHEHNRYTSSIHGSKAATRRVARCGSKCGVIEHSVTKNRWVTWQLAGHTAAGLTWSGKGAPGKGTPAVEPTHTWHSPTSVLTPVAGCVAVSNIQRSGLPVANGT